MKHWRWSRLARWEVFLAAVLVADFVFNALASPYFLDPQTLSDATFNFTEKALVALPMALLIIGREIDVSVAGILALASVAMGVGAQHGLPTIQGVLVLFDAARGEPLAMMDSASITTLRTAAASAVAARHLARRGARTMTIVGCGVQARAHVAAMRAVLSLDQIAVFDLDVPAAKRFAAEMRALHGVSVTAADDLARATLASDVIVTCTPSRAAFLGTAHVAPGAFIAAVGADNEQKQEIEPALLRASAVVVDDLEQCATMGDLHHAIEAGVMSRTDVRATLGDVIAGRRRGRLNNDEIVVFDSTGVAIEDVAAAAVVWGRARADSARVAISLVA